MVSGSKNRFSNIKIVTLKPTKFLKDSKMATLFELTINNKIVEAWFPKNYTEIELYPHKDKGIDKPGIIKIPDWLYQKIKSN